MDQMIDVGKILQETLVMHEPENYGVPIEVAVQVAERQDFVDCTPPVGYGGMYYIPADEQELRAMGQAMHPQQYLQQFSMQQQQMSGPFGYRSYPQQVPGGFSHPPQNPFLAYQQQHQAQMQAQQQGMMSFPPPPTPQPQDNVERFAEQFVRRDQDGSETLILSDIAKGMVQAGRQQRAQQQNYYPQMPGGGGMVPRQTVESMAIQNPPQNNAFEQAKARAAAQRNSIPMTQYNSSMVGGMKGIFGPGTDGKYHIPPNLNNLPDPRALDSRTLVHVAQETVEEEEVRLAQEAEKRRLREEYQEEMQKNKLPNGKIKVEIVKVPIDYDETNAAMDYKEAAVLKSVLKQEEEDYKLARTIARYNEQLANELLWHKANSPLDEYLQIKDECVDQLIKYTNADPASLCKDVVNKFGDQVQISRIPHEFTEEELEKIAAEAKAIAESGKITEKKVIQSYQRQADVIHRNLHKNTGFTGNRIYDTILALQALIDIRVIPSNKDTAMQRMNERSQALSAIDAEHKRVYMNMKYLKRLAYRGNPEEFDAYFDCWFYGPKFEKRRDPIEIWRRYKEACGVELIRRNEMMEFVPPEYWQKVREREFEAGLRRFDKGRITTDMKPRDYLKLMDYLANRCVEMNIEEKIRNVRNMYNPNSYMQAIYNSYDTQQRLPYQQQFEFMDSKEYNAKRHQFIDSIFHSKPRGMIS